MFNSYDMEEIYKRMKDSGFFPEPLRNVPQYCRPKEQGRNEKCNCGSGKKYKNCCGKSQD